jgi:MFS family permease
MAIQQPAPCTNRPYSTLAATIITPATTAIATDLNTSAALVNICYAVYIVGAGLGALLAGAPLTSALGRKPALLIPLALQALLLLGAALSRTPAELAALRALAGASAGAALPAAAATLADLWPRPSRRRRALADLALLAAPLLLAGACAGSVAGRTLVDADGRSWRWAQAAPALAAAPPFLLGWFARETAAGTGAGRRARAWSATRRALRLVVRPSTALLGVWAGGAAGAVLALYGAAAAASDARGAGNAGLAPLAPLVDDIGVGAVAAGTLVGLLGHLLHLLLIHGPLAARWASSARANTLGPAAAADEEMGDCGAAGCSGGSSARTSVVDIAIALEEQPPASAQRRTRDGDAAAPPPHYRLLMALPCTLALPASLLVVGLTTSSRDDSAPTHRFVPLTFVAVLAACAALAFLAGLEYLMDAFGDESSDDGSEARVAVVAAYVAVVFAVGGGFAIGVHVGEQAVGVKVVFGGLAAGLAILGCGVWGLWFFGRRAARK